MIVFSPVGFMIIGFVIAILLIVMGFREKRDYARKVRLVRAGGVLLGLMIIATGLIWYGYLASVAVVRLDFEDVFMLTLLSSIGGLIIGISSYIPIGQLQ
jgi:hypothetical protein